MRATIALYKICASLLLIIAGSKMRWGGGQTKTCNNLRPASQRELEASERACDGALEEMRSEERDEFIQYLKYEGKYDGDISDCYFQEISYEG